MRRAAWLLGLAVAVALLPACSPSDRAPAAASAAPETTAAAPPIIETAAPPEPEEAHFSLGVPDIQAVRAAAEIPGNVQNGIQDLLDRYLNQGMLTPLREAKPVEDLGGLFAGPALERASGPDRVALLDEGLPRVARLAVDVASAQLTALVGPAGVATVAARIHVSVAGAVSNGGLFIDRTGELHLVSDGDAWKVGGYDVRVSRSGPDGVITTTTTSGP